MRFLTLIVFLFILLKASVIDKDSIRFTAVDKGSKYLSFSAGLIYVIKDGNYAGHANRFNINQEYFVKDKVSIAPCLMVNYSYGKYSYDQVFTSISLMGRKYFKIKNNYSFFAYSAVSLVNATSITRDESEYNYIKGGISFANGLGFSIMPLRKKKNCLGRFGFDVSFNLLSFHTSGATRFPYSTMSLKYRIK